MHPTPCENRLSIMVIRYQLRCNNCGAKTLLRIRVGSGDREPFSFECERCSQSISGAMLLDQQSVKILGLSELSGATEVHESPSSGDYEHRHDNWFLLQPASPDDPASFSGFIGALQRQGPQMLDQLQNQAAFQEVIELSPVIARTLRNYQRQQWTYFASGAAQVLGEELDESSHARLYGLLQLLEKVFQPLLDPAQDGALFVEYIRLVDELQTSRSTAFREFQDLIKDRGYLGRAHHDALELAIEWLPLMEEFRPLIGERDPGQPSKALSSSLRVSSATRLDNVMRVYARAYETICRGFTVVVGLVNLADRGGCEVFGGHPSSQFKKFQPTTLESFDHASNAPKVGLVTTHSLFRRWVDEALDSSLRNAIAHNSVRWIMWVRQSRIDPQSSPKRWRRSHTRRCYPKSCTR